MGDGGSRLLRETAHDGAVVLALDDPSRRNALSLELVEDLVETLDRLEADPEVGAIVLTGKGKAFCAGADLGDFRGGTALEPRAVYEGFLRVERCRLPTIAAVNGPAVGAGLNLALACDVRIAGARGTFISRFVELGLHPGGGHTWMLHRLVGSQVAAAMVLAGVALDGAAAERHGLAWRCVPDETLQYEALELARLICSGPRELVVRAKATLGSMGGISDYDAAVEVELEQQRWSFGQPWFADRLAALEQRVRTPRGDDPDDVQD